MRIFTVMVIPPKNIDDENAGPYRQQNVLNSLMLYFLTCIAN
jgi:hypothetical protein